METQSQSVLQPSCSKKSARVASKRREPKKKERTPVKIVVSEECESSETEWEDVASGEEEKEIVIPKDGVEITLDAEDVIKRRRRNKKEFDWNNYARLCVNRFKKEVQLDLHKVHVLCLLSHGFFVNDLINGELLSGIVLSTIPDEFCKKLKPKRTDLNTLKDFIDWYRNEFRLSLVDVTNCDYHKRLTDEIEGRKITRNEDFVLIGICMLRLIGFDVRFMMSLQPISGKPPDLIKPKAKSDEEGDEKTNKSQKGSKKNDGNKNKTLVKGKKKSSMKRNEETTTENEDEDKTLLKSKRKCARKTVPNSEKKTSARRKTTAKKETEEDDGEGTKKLRRRSKKTYEESEEDEERSEQDVEFADNDDDFIPEQEIKPRRSSSLKVPTKRRSTSASGDDGSRKKAKSETSGENGNDFWAEVYLEKLSEWVCLDFVYGRVNCTAEMEARSTKPFIYVVSIDNKNKIKDLTRRYAERWLTLNRKFRLDPDWWTQTIEPYRPRLSNREKKENTQLDEMLLNRPLPTTIGEFVGHPLYALTRHLLKFEAIYPPDSVPVGYIRREPVYSRDCVQTLHSRETWLKEARMIRIGEKPYKVVKARPRWNKMLGKVETDLPLEIYGPWQTEPYQPPVASNGVVPRNEYGNVDMFKECMLPVGTVHLRLPRLLKVARKLGIDCAAAMTGWDFGKMGSRPIYDGWIVCEEFEDTLTAAWRQQMKVDFDRIGEKREKRVYGNWRRLIRAVLIRERLNTKYFKIDDK